jgi:hypothetical protein
LAEKYLWRFGNGSSRMFEGSRNTLWIGQTSRPGAWKSLRQ